MDVANQHCSCTANLVTRNRGVYKRFGKPNSKWATAVAGGHPVRYHVALVVSGLFVSPALGANNDQHDARRHGDDYSRQDYVDSPPPVVYAPDESPGISLFIPIQLR
jgi:hypothetical protein